MNPPAIHSPPVGGLGNRLPRGAGLHHRPAQSWASWIDKENDYWVARGGFSGSFAEKIKKVEKGAAIKITVKILLGGNVLLSVVVIYMLLHFPAPRPFRATLPPPVKVVPHRQPAH